MLRKMMGMAVCVTVFAALLEAAQVPRKSPEFGISLNNGKQVLLSEYRGKAVALMFILTYCGHCQQTVEVLKKLQAEYGPRGFQVLATAIEDMAAMAVPDFIKRYQPNFPLGYNNRHQTVAYLQFNPDMRMMMPQLVFVDREGTIRAQYTGDDPFFGAKQETNLRAKIEELLAPAQNSQSKSTRNLRGRRPSTSPN
jgi:peroxiredoxin